MLKMQLALALLLRLFPLYLFIGVGFVTGRTLALDGRSVASILVYVLTPVIIFHGAATSTLTAGSLSLPLFLFAFSSLIGILFWFIGSFLWQDTTKNILGYAAGSVNSGYFGLPVAIALYGQRALPVMVFAIMGLICMEYSVGFLMVANGTHTIVESTRKLLRIPTIYAFLLGIAMHFSHVSLTNTTYTTTIDSVSGAFTVLGMMLIGIALADLRTYKVDFRFLGLTFVAKYLFWPALMMLSLVMDSSFFHLWDPFTHRILMLLSILPLGANTVVWASLLKAQPQKAALAVLVSTLFGLAFIPIVVSVFLQ